MKQFVIGLLAVMLMCLAACATHTAGTTMAEPAPTVADAGGLPDIAPYDDPAIPALDAPATE